MRVVDIIQKKRDGIVLKTKEISFLLNEYINGNVPDYQMSSFLMATYFTNMTDRELIDFTLTMRDSGDIITFPKINKFLVDKHSTGGVGDKTTIALAAMVSACGVPVAKMSGRGLGHTGGTLDKLESIPGFKCDIEKEAFEKQVKNINIAVIGQSAHLVLADKKLYALRDVTATVKSIPLIASSIMSKKLASGSDAILLDVKYGEGAFMKSIEEATLLAQTMMMIGKKLNRDVRAVISNMNQPLGNTIGNALEVKEAIATLNNEGPKDFTQLCIELGSIMLLQAKVVDNIQDAKQKLQAVIENKLALNKLKQMVSAQGGDVSVIDNPNLLPKAKYSVDIMTKHTGYVHDLKALELGVLAMKLGAGRETKEQNINHAVGITLHKKVGDYILENDILATIDTDNELSDQWIKEFYECFEISPRSIEKPRLIEKII